MKILWSDEAYETFEAIITDIETTFTEKESIAFVEQTFEVIDAIARFPNLYEKTTVKGLKNVRRALIHPHTTLFYHVSKTHVELLFFWLNRDNPQKLKSKTKRY